MKSLSHPSDPSPQGMGGGIGEWNEITPPKGECNEITPPKGECNEITPPKGECNEITPPKGEWNEMGGGSPPNEHLPLLRGAIAGATTVAQLRLLLNKKRFFLNEPIPPIPPLRGGMGGGIGEWSTAGFPSNEIKKIFF